MPTYPKLLHSAKLRHASGQTIPTATSTLVEYDTEDWDDGGIATVSTQYPIVAVSTGAGTLTVAGDRTATFVAGYKFRVIDSTGNDGVYEAASSSYSAPNTTIAINTSPGGDMETSVADATADGSIDLVGIRLQRGGRYRLAMFSFWAGFPDQTTSTPLVYRNGTLIDADVRQASGMSSLWNRSLVTLDDFATGDLIDVLMNHTKGSDATTSTSAGSMPWLQVDEVPRYSEG